MQRSLLPLQHYASFSPTSLACAGVCLGFTVRWALRARAQVLVAAGGSAVPGDRMPEATCQGCLW